MNMDLERIRHLNDKPERDGRYVLYWMQASQRAEYNHALEYAIAEGNRLRRPVVVVFGLTDSFPEANERHYRFMLEGLRETQQALAKRGILMIVRRESPPQAAAAVAKDAALAVTDRGYLRVERGWRSEAAALLECPLVQVETNVVVPVETAADGEQFAARTLRPRIYDKLEQFMRPVRHIRPTLGSLGLKIESIDLGDPAAVLRGMRIDRSVGPVDTFRGGTSAAKKRLREFIRSKLERYDQDRNDPTIDGQSNLSPYLHFGQISPLYAALKVAETRSSGVDVFLEELIIRRELSMNFVLYNEHYDTFDSLPDWARGELKKHSSDQREHNYSAARWEAAETHDPIWNAAQNEMRCTGKMHGYMRMYWGKKILEWTAGVEEAYDIALRLNNRYEIDGRDPNGFTGVAWCFGKHDRAWPSRPVFGKVRYMNDRGLRRKFDVAEYVRRVERIRHEAGG